MSNSKILSPVARAFLMIIGVIAVALGILGVFLPLLPTTPFLLLASFCFARSSNRFNNWLLNNRLLGSYIKDYVEKRAIKRSVKIITLTILWVTIFTSISMIKSFPLVKLLLLVIAVAVTLHVASLRNSDVE